MTKKNTISTQDNLADRTAQLSTAWSQGETGDLFRDTGYSVPAKGGEEVYFSVVVMRNGFVITKKASKLAGQIHEYLQLHPGSTREQLRQALRMTDKRFEENLKRLLDSGSVYAIESQNQLIVHVDQEQPRTEDAGASIFNSIWNFLSKAGASAPAAV